MTYAIDVQEVSYVAREHFYSKPRRIIDAVSFTVKRGQICGFVGANGAGKTTTMALMLGQLTPDAGRIALMGQNAKRPEARRSVGYLPERQPTPAAMTAWQLVRAHGLLRGLSTTDVDEEVERALQLVQLSEHQQRLAQHFSKGMLQRLGLAQALVGQPKLLFLDEPLSGLDPPGRHLVRELLLQLQEAGCTIFFSTHILADVELLCDQVVVLKNGSVAFCGPYARLVEELPTTAKEQVEVVAINVAPQASLLAQSLHLHPRVQGKTHRYLASSLQDANTLAAAIIAANGTVQKLAPFGGSALEALLLNPEQHRQVQ